VDKLYVSSSSVEKDMGYSYPEFIQQFKVFASDLEYQINDSNIVILGKKNCLKIKLQQQADRIIASLKIPHIIVTFTFENYSKEQQSLFLKQFELSFHKGGG